MLNCPSAWRWVALMGLAGVGAQAVLAGSACGSPAQLSAQPRASYPSQYLAAMEWERYHSVMLINLSKSHWRLRPFGEKRSPMLDLKDPNRDASGTLHLPPGQLLILGFLFNEKEDLFSAQFLVEDNHEERGAVLGLQVDEGAADGGGSLQMTLVHARDGKPFLDSKVLYCDGDNQVFQFVADAYRGIPEAKPGQKVPPIEESGESLLLKGTPSFPAAHQHGSPSFPSTDSKMAPPSP